MEKSGEKRENLCEQEEGLMLVLMLCEVSARFTFILLRAHKLQQELFNSVLMLISASAAPSGRREFGAKSNLIKGIIHLLLFDTFANANK